MKIVVDTTVFGQGFNSRSADIGLLKSFIESTHAQLCVPSIVYDEAMNLVRKTIEDVNTKLSSAQRLTGDEKAYAKLNVKGLLSKYVESLDALLKHLNARVLPYPKVGHPDLIKRALAPSKPFVSSGRGYRDALIWFSVLELAESCDKEIAFISANSDDWCQSKKDLRLHDDLLSDLSSMGIGVSRVRFFLSLGEFIQGCAVATLPISSPSMEITSHPPDYLQLLVDGKELVETMLADALPDFLRQVSRADARVEDVEVMAISTPREMQALPIRIMDSERRFLQFSAEYKLALQFLIKREDLLAWSQRLSFHQRQDWNESFLRVQTTIPVRVSFHMIERGEATEGFSIVSILRTNEYKIVFTGTDPVAIKLHQTEIHAPEHTTMGIVKCESCGEEFALGYHRFFPPTETWKQYENRFKQTLVEDHKAERPHANQYNLLGPYRM